MILFSPSSSWTTHFPFSTAEIKLYALWTYFPMEQRTFLSYQQALVYKHLQHPLLYGSQIILPPNVRQRTTARETLKHSLWWTNQKVCTQVVNRITYLKKKKVLERRRNARNAIQEFQLQIAFAEPYYNCLLKKQGTLSFATRLSWRQVTVAIRQFLTKRNAIYTLPVALSPTRTVSVIPTPRQRKGVWWTTAFKTPPPLFSLVVAITWNVGNRTRECPVHNLLTLSTTVY